MPPPLPPKPAKGSLRGMPQIGEDTDAPTGVLGSPGKALPRQTSGKIRVPLFGGSSRRKEAPTLPELAEQGPPTQVIQGHNFTNFTFATPAVCKHCHKAVWRYDKESQRCKQSQLQEVQRWSLRKDGYRCKVCNVDVHVVCAQFLDFPCQMGHFMANIRQSLVRRSRTRSIDDYAQIVRPSVGYNLEDGLSGVLQGARELAAPAALDQASWYTLYFLNGEHDHFVMSDKKHTFDPFIISIMREVEEDLSDVGEGPESGEESGYEEEDQPGRSAGEGALSRPSFDNNGDSDVDAEAAEAALSEKERKKLEKKKEKDRKEREKREKKERKEREKKEKKLQKKLAKAKEHDEDSLYRVIVWKKGGKEQWTIPVKHNELLSGAEIADIVLPDKNGTLRMMEKTSPLFSGLSKELTMMEREEFSTEFKFGVLYSTKGQTHEDEFFGNQTGSAAFYEFMDIIGKKTPLQGYEGFKGGLDTENGGSGEFSYVTAFEGNSVMYHVCPLLPYSATDTQQIKRKRHIGNDICCIVFQDSPGCCFSPRAVKSNFAHCFIAVCLEGVYGGVNRYRVNVTTRDTVPPFGPTVPDPPVFVEPQELREFVLQKLINAERSALYSETFQEKRERTLGAHLSYIHSRYAGESTGKKTAVKAKLGESRRAPKGLTLDIVSATTNPSMGSLPSPFSGSRSARYDTTRGSRPFQQESAPGGSTSNSPPSATLRTRVPFDGNSMKVRKASIFSPQEPETSSTDQNQPKLIFLRPLLKRRGSAPALFVSNPSLVDPDAAHTNADFAPWEKISPEMLGIKAMREV